MLMQIDMVTRFPLSFQPPINEPSRGKLFVSDCRSEIQSNFMPVISASVGFGVRGQRGLETRLCQPKI